jgi:hypothetical protein
MPRARCTSALKELERRVVVPLLPALSPPSAPIKLLLRLCIEASLRKKAPPPV